MKKMSIAKKLQVAANFQMIVLGLSLPEAMYGVIVSGMRLWYTHIALAAGMVILLSSLILTLLARRDYTSSDKSERTE